MNPGAPSDVDTASAAIAQGVVVRALSAHAIGLREHGWNGLLFGYAQVEDHEIDPMVARVARAIAGMPCGHDAGSRKNPTLV